jgi:hypothetical protein
VEHVTFTQAVLFVGGAFLALAVTVLVLGLILAIDREDFVSERWIREQEQAPRVEVETVGRVEHRLLVDGRELVRHHDERVIDGVRRELRRTAGR